MTDTEFKTGDIWNFTLSLPANYSPVKGLGKILYSIKQEDVIISVIKFTSIEENARNKIIKLCFEEEANRLKAKTRTN